MPTHTISENLQRLTVAKTAISTAITNKGGTVTQGDGLEDFPNDIASIPSGVDTSNDTVTPETLAEGVTAHDASGAQITGTMENYVYYVPEGTTEITRSTIPDKTKWFKIVLPASVTTIGDDAFSGCSNLPRITIPDGVTSISRFAFSLCSVLVYVTIPNSVVSVGSYAFSNTPAFIIGLSNDVNYIAKWVVGASISIASCTLKSSTIGIADSAFYNCTSLTDITIPNKVKYIGESAFSGCTSLASVTIPDGVKYIESFTFRNCTSLESVILPNSISFIDPLAFSGCTNLRTITINKPQDSIWGAPWGATNATVVWTG